MEGLNGAESDEEDEGEPEAEESYRPAVPTVSAENRKLSSVRKREKLRKKQEEEKRKEKLKRMRQSEIYRYWVLPCSTSASCY